MFKALKLLDDGMKTFCVIEAKRKHVQGRLVGGGNKRFQKVSSQ